MKFSAGKWRAEGRVRLLRARGSAELRKVASGSATQRGEKREPAIERRRKYTVLGFDLGEREEQVVFHASALALAMTDEARREAKM